MLTGKHVVFLGGDARQLEVIRCFIEMNARVSLVGYDNLKVPIEGAILQELNPKKLCDADVLVFPILGADENGEVLSNFTSEQLVVSALYFEALPKHCTVFSGIITPFLSRLCESNNLSLCSLVDRDDVAIYNSIPTVEGALMVAIQNTQITIHGSSSVVLGFGRVGLSLARMLHAIGARVKVGVRKSASRARAVEMGLEAFDTRDLHDHLENTDIVFNTIPAMLLTEEILNNFPREALIIDLAHPGAVDCAAAKKQGIRAISAPSLPGMVAPKTAGSILAKTMIELISAS